MIIYNKTWLDNLNVHEQAQGLFNAGCLTADELIIIKAKYPVGFYTPGIFARAGLFILTCICVIFLFGLISLLMADKDVIDNFGWPLSLSLVCIGALEVMIKNKNYHRAGIDDALLWLGAGLLAGSVWIMLTKGNGHAPNYMVFYLLVFIFGLCFCLRYADRVMSVVTCLSFFATVFFGWQKISLGNATMPFIMILAAGAIYTFTLNLVGKIKVPYYDQCLAFVQITALIILYAAGNYLVVDKLNAQLNDTITIGTPTSLTWSPFFWGWTMLTPVIYLAFGVLKKNMILLRTGLILIAGAIFTFRTYYHVMAIEVALLLGGALLLAITYAITKYLKNPKHGFTIIDIDHLENADNVKLEALFTAATLAHQPGAPAQAKSRFGGGDFGGGGADGTF